MCLDVFEAEYEITKPRGKKPIVNCGAVREEVLPSVKRFERVARAVMRGIDECLCMAI
jgi:hypothetical protein